MEIIIWTACVSALLIVLIIIGVLLNRQPYTWRDHQKEFSKQLTEALLEIDKRNRD